MIHVKNANISPIYRSTTTLRLEGLKQKLCVGLCTFALAGISEAWVGPRSCCYCRQSSSYAWWWFSPYPFYTFGPWDGRRYGSCPRPWGACWPPERKNWTSCRHNYLWWNVSQLKTLDTKHQNDNYVSSLIHVEHKLKHDNHLEVIDLNTNLYVQLQLGLQLVWKPNSKRNQSSQIKVWFGPPMENMRPP